MLDGKCFSPIYLELRQHLLELDDLLGKDSTIAIVRLEFPAIVQPTDPFDNWQ